MRTAVNKPLRRVAHVLVKMVASPVGRVQRGVKCRWPDDSILRRRTRFPRIALTVNVAESISGAKTGSLGGTTAQDWAARSAIVAREAPWIFMAVSRSVFTRAERKNPIPAQTPVG